MSPCVLSFIIIIVLIGARHDGPVDGLFCKRLKVTGLQHGNYSCGSESCNQEEGDDQTSTKGMYGTGWTSNYKASRGT